MSAAECNVYPIPGYCRGLGHFSEEELGQALQEIVVALLEMGADTSIVHPQLGMTPLHLACLRGWTSTDFYVLSWNEDEVDARGLGGQTALHVAARANQPSVIDKLLSLQLTDVNAKDDLGETALDKAIRWSCDEAVAALKEHTKI